MISEIPSHILHEERVESPDVSVSLEAEATPSCTISAVTMSSDVSYPLELFCQRKESYVKKMAAERERWEEEKRVRREMGMSDLPIYKKNNDAISQ